MRPDAPFHKEASPRDKPHRLSRGDGVSILFLTALSVGALGPGRVGRGCTALERSLLLGGLSLAGALAGALLSTLSGIPRHSSGSVLAFAALTFAGGRMLLDAVCPPESCLRGSCLHAVAVDALLVGLALPFFPVHPGSAAALIGGTACALGALSSLLPERVSKRIQPWLSAAGGLSLTCIGMHLLLRTLL